MTKRVSRCLCGELIFDADADGEQTTVFAVAADNHQPHRHRVRWLDRQTQRAAIKSRLVVRPAARSAARLVRVGLGRSAKSVIGDPFPGVRHPRESAGLSGETPAATKQEKSPPQFRLGRAGPVGLQPTDLDPWASTPWVARDKTWIRGSSPRKTI